MIKTDKEIERILMISLREPYVEFKSDHPEGDRQKLYRFRKRMIEETPLLGVQELVVRVRDKDWIVLEWKVNETTDLTTERPLEIHTSPPKPKRQEKPAFKLPKWLEDRRDGFIEFRQKAMKMGPEYRGAWEQLDALITATDYLADALEHRISDPELERFIRSADLKDALSAFMGEREEDLDPIEILRLQIAEIPTDDKTREEERLKLIERRERLMLERDIRLQSTSPLD